MSNSKFLATEETSLLVWLHIGLDIIASIGMLWLAIYIHPPASWEDRYLIVALMGSLMFILFAKNFNAYSPQHTNSLFNLLKTLYTSWILGWLLVVALVFLYKGSHEFSRISLTIWAVSNPLALVLHRYIIKICIALIYNNRLKTKKQCLIIGAGNVGQQLAKTINNTHYLEVFAFIDDKTELQNKKINGIEIIGKISDELVHIISKNNIKEVYICLPMRSETATHNVLSHLTNTTAIVKFVPDLFAFDLLHAKWSEFNGIPVVSVYDSPLNSVNMRFMKRLEDIVLTIIILLFASPIMLIVALGVIITSPGGIFYRQKRISLNGKSFNMLKFRSMPMNSEKSGVNWGNSQQKTTTAFGAFIRKTSLDELPQFINVLKGDMSIVGPRPERDVFVEQFRKEIPRYMQKHLVKSGITGLAQIKGLRGDTDLKQRIRYDLQYINHWSIWLDLKIILLTPIKGFVNKNAY